MKKFVIFESYDGFYKIAEVETEVRYKKYGYVKIKDSLEINTWYDLDYNIVKEPENTSNETGSKNTEFDDLCEDANSKRTKVDDKNIRTIQKYASKKNKKKTKCFRIREMNPMLLHKIYKIKWLKAINSMSSSCLALLQFYLSDNTLVFDKVKGLLIYSLLYKTDHITIHRKDKSCHFDTLKYLDNKTYDFIEDGSDKQYDTVIVAGEYESFIQKYKNNIGNLIIFYIQYREEATKLFYELLRDESFIDVSVFDFFTREWQIYENIRPQMNCDLRCGFVVRATKIKS